MKNFVFLFIVLFLVPSFQSSATKIGRFDFVTNDNKWSSSDKEPFIFTNCPEVDYTTIDVNLVSPHFLGEKVAIKMYYFKKIYVSRSKLDFSGVGSENVIEKSAIYNSIMNMQKMVRKSLKKKEVSRDDAEIAMLECLDKASRLYYINSSSFETHLEKLSSWKEYVIAYRSVIFK